jgi:hypothetical protein
MTDRGHLAQFGLLILIYIIGIYIFLSTPDYSLKRLTAVWLAILYPAWGVLHHFEHKNLSPSILGEYTLIGIISLVILLTVAN